jgi:hypothetical protein
MNGSQVAAAFALVFGALVSGCQSGGVGDPCTPEDEYQRTFAGYAVTETNIESRSFQCETRLCLVNHFQGRTSCPYGQSQASVNDADETSWCHIPGTADPANRIQNPDKTPVEVRPQLTGRRAEDAVYCSCRCAGPDPGARYCACPSGYTCSELLKDIGLGSSELAGSYCIKTGTEYNKAATSPSCNRANGDCGNPDGT